MSPMHLALTGAVCGVVLWFGRRVPLVGPGRWLVTGCRLAAATALCFALWGNPHRRIHEVPRRVVYLVDGSASIDTAQREWIIRRIASLESVRPKPVERAVIVFGRDAQVAVPFGREPLTDLTSLGHALDAARIDRSGTNLEAALLAAVAAVPPAHPAGVVLLSDGRETLGNVTGILSYARRLGLSVFPSPAPRFGQAKTVWEDLAVPPVVQRGSPVGVQLVVYNGTPRTKAGQVTLSLAGVVLKRQRVAVRSGWQVFSLSVPTLQRGTMALEVGFTIPEEGLSEHRAAYTEVEGPPQLLLVSDRTSTLPALAAALKRREMEVAAAHLSDLPSDTQRLLDYDAVMLFNLPKSALSAAQAAALRTYVTEQGGGLVMVGLGGELAEEIQHPAPLDELLPVQFEPKGLQESKRRVCIVLLIDRSASMLGPRIAATKRAAVELVKQLSPEDLVGVLAFDTQPYVVAEVQPAAQIGEWLVEKLVKLRSGGGTDVLPALAASENRLDMTGATLRHIILLSDGYTPFHKAAYDALITSFRLKGTTVSTIGIGAPFINTDYMDWLARSTGGTFYQMRTLDELPSLIVRDTQKELERLPFTEGYFRPVKTPTTDWFAETGDWPPLRGYLTTTAKPGARVDLTVNGGDGNDPLFARWSTGRGRVVSFTSDGDRRWTPDWIRWPGFDGAWAQVIRWAMRPRLTEELFVWVDDSRGVPQLIVEGELHDPHGELTAAEGPERLPLPLIQTGTWRWSAPLEQVPSGWYQLTLESHLPALSAVSAGTGQAGVPDASRTGAPQAGRGAEPVFAKRWVQVGIPAASDETPGQPPREALLRQMARSTNGAYDVPDGAFVPPVSTAATTEPLGMWWLPLVVLTLLVDVLLRGGTML